MEWRIGTMGWSYEDWVDGFYPRELPAGRWIEFYAKHFDTVEIDSTFYAIPPAGRLRRWAERVPDHFRFTLKTPRLITHDLEPSRAIEPMRAFVEVVRELGEKLGVVLIQFGPSFSPRQFDGLVPLLDSLPQTMDFAVEFRDAAWWAHDHTYDLLATRRIAWVIGDYDQPPLPPQVTADFLYVRWIGTHNRFPHHVEEQQDRTARQAWWHRKLLEIAGSSVKTVWGMFNNDFTGNSIRAANRFKAMLGQQVKPTAEMEQGRLF
jgi:uncharacterized protein YecE (DUF72 family)